MEYVSAAEAALNWGVSKRRVTELCRQARIREAVLVGNSWMIPKNTVKPGDPRKNHSESPEPSNGKTLLPKSSPASPAERKVLENFMRSYYAGKLQEAKEVGEHILKHEPSPLLQMYFSLFLALCAMHQGNFSVWERHLEALGKVPADSPQEQARKELFEAILNSSIYQKGGYPLWLTEGRFSEVSDDALPTARHIYIKWLFLQGRSQEALVLTEPFADQCRREEQTIEETYIRLLAATMYHTAGTDERAAEQLSLALSVAIPENIFIPFAEYSLPLDRLLDSALKPYGEAPCKIIGDLSERFMEHWAHFYDSLALKLIRLLTEREFEAMKFAAFGLSNDEIARRMGISINTAKSYLREVYSKLGVQGRNDLRDSVAFLFPAPPKQ